MSWEKAGNQAFATRTPGGKYREVDSDGISTRYPPLRNSRGADGRSVCPA